jgi:Flp pilus assembly protein TadD
MKNSLWSMTIDDLLDQAHSDLAVGNLHGARDAFHKCVELAPDNAEAWHALGMTQMKLGELDAAIAAGLRATELNPNEAMYWTSLSLAFVRANKIPEAEAAGAKAKVISWGGKIAKGGWEAIRPQQSAQT